MLGTIQILREPILVLAMVHCHLITILAGGWLETKFIEKCDYVILECSLREGFKKCGLNPTSQKKKKKN